MTDGAAALLARFGAPDACAARLLCDDHPPDHVAFTVVEPDLSARELTYGELTHESARFAEALAVRDGRIVFIGTTADVRTYAGPHTTVTDLHGRMVMPGIVDGHFHGTRSADCAMGYEGGTVAEVLAKLQACLDRPEQAAHKGSNVRFYATQFFGEALLPRGTELSRDDLDRLDTTRPIRLRNADGHKFWMNSKAIDNAVSCAICGGIAASTPTRRSSCARPRCMVLSPACHSVMAATPSHRPPSSHRSKKRRSEPARGCQPPHGVTGVLVGPPRWRRRTAGSRRHARSGSRHCCPRSFCAAGAR